MDTDREYPQSYSIEQRRHMMESLGFQFEGDRVVLQLGGGSSLSIDEKLVLDPPEGAWHELQQKIDELLGDKIDVFNPSDKKHQTTFAGERVRGMGRIWDHDEYVCCPVKLRRYYKYLELRAPAETDDATWQAIGQFVVCVIAAIGLLALISAYVPGGKVIIANFATEVVTVAAGCLALIESVNGSSKQAAYLRTYVGR